MSAEQGRGGGAGRLRGWGWGLEGAATRQRLAAGLLRTGVAGQPHGEGLGPGFSWAPPCRSQHPSIYWTSAGGGGCPKHRDYEGARTPDSSPGLRGIKRTWSPTLLPSPAPGAPPGERKDSSVRDNGSFVTTAPGRARAQAAEDLSTGALAGLPAPDQARAGLPRVWDAGRGSPCV